MNINMKDKVLVNLINGVHSDLPNREGVQPLRVNKGGRQVILIIVVRGVLTRTSLPYSTESNLPIYNQISFNILYN